MLQGPAIPTPTTLGADLRALRKARGLTLADIATMLGRSIGWVSQVERDISSPDSEDLRRIADCLGVPLSLFFGQADAPDHERGFVVRAHARRAIGIADGLTESLVSPDLTDDFEVVHSVFAPGAASKEHRRATQEVGYLVSGRLTIGIAGHQHDIGPGDSFRIRGEAYRWSNPHDEPAIAIWVIAPPVY